MLRTCVRTLRGVLQRRRVARELDDELQFHIERETEWNIGRGMSARDAKQRALRDFGGVLQTREATRDVRTLAIEGIWMDVRHALRAMRRQPGFTSVAALTLALGIGVNAATLSLAYGILIRPLPYTEPSRLVVLNLLFADGGDLGFSAPMLQEWLTRLPTVEVAAGYQRREVTVRAGGRSTVVPAAVVTERFFDVLGTRAAFGHARVSEATSALVLGVRRSAEIVGVPRADDLVGAPVTVSDRGYVVAGVIPADFAFPGDDIGVWLPAPRSGSGAKADEGGYSRIVARLKPGATLEQLRDEANRLRRTLNPQSDEVVSVTALGAVVLGGTERLLTAAVLGALMVLLVACSNVATLFIGRDVARQREFAARMALGATRTQLARSVLVEAALVAAVASALGLVLGMVALREFISIAAGVVSGLRRVELDFTVAVAIVVVTIVVTLLCGALPAWHAVRADFGAFLRPTAGSRPRSWRIRRLLVTAQIASSCVLLIGAGLLARTVSALMHESPGFEPSGALEARLVLSDTVLLDHAGRATFVTDVLDRVRALPGVRRAGFGNTLPPRTPPVLISMRIVADDRDETHFMKLGAVTPGYLPALRARFVSGRDFQTSDGRPGAPVVILSESAARFCFPHEDAVGRTIAPLPAMLGLDGHPQVVGVVADMKYDGLDSPTGSAVYLPWTLRPFGSGYLVVRTVGDPMRLAPDIRNVVRALDSAVALPELQSLEAVLAQAIADRRVHAASAMAFGVIAVLVAFTGIMATLSTLVTERRRDLAIRSAIGASPAHLVWSVVGQGLTLIAIGLVIGTAIGAAAGRALGALLYGVSPYDLTTFAVSTLLIGSGATVMTYVAAERARRTDPIAVLRCE